MPDLHEENLTREEARARSAAISVSHYQVHADLSDAAGENAATYPVETRIDLTYTPTHDDAGLSDYIFLDYIGASVESLSINGEPRPIDTHVGGARILLSGLSEGQNVVEIRSHSRFSRSGEGMHRFVDPSDGQVYLYTQYEPADCRRVFPVFEQPDIKARFRFAVTGPVTWQLRSNSPEVSRQTVSGHAAGLEGVGLVKVSFAETEPMSTYITTLLAGPYHLVSDQWRGSVPGGEPFSIDLALLCRRSLAEHLDAEELFTVTKQGLDFFHAEFAYPYPWGAGAHGRQKYDQVFVPEYNLGAMENPGLVTFTEAYVFDTAATQAQHETRANTILHEMAHMWFGDLVTMGWWDDLWLKESFADYMGAYGVDSATEFTTGWISFANSRKGWAYVQDQLPTTHPIVADITDLEAADQNFDGITYAKGAAVLKQLAAYAGQDSFRTAAQRYFARHAFGNATLQDFLSELEATTGKDMHTWAQAWLQTAGIPVLAAEIDDAGTLSVRQSGTDPTTGDPVARPHVTRVGLFTLDGTGALTRTASVPVEIPPDAPDGLTEVPGINLPQEEVPRLILPNDEDLTYAKLSLDPASVAAALSCPVGDPLARATVWAALWSMVRDAELTAARFVNAVTTLGLQIPEVSVASTLLRQADAATDRFAPASQRAELEAQLTSRLAEFIAAAEGSDVQRAAARTLASVSRRSPEQLDLIADLLDGNAADNGISGLDVDEELRWAFLQALAAHGRADAQMLDAELNSRTTARSRIAHRLALAARPDRKVKQAAFDQALTGTDAEGVELSNDHLSATVAGFCADPQGLTADFAEAYFESLTGVWEKMTQGQATRVIRGLFPGSQSLSPGQQPQKHPVAVLTRDWLAEHTAAPAALRRILVEEQDHLLRALSAQAGAA
ncbi:aminopeptidase N [Garicola koreensis]|uniref:Aminopeptidase N n=1 Tax=Garicola koreensis TaxID=1262554 RepID=A0A7W5U0I8_9MICC|nr:aminopeptidase N [Garicola koreensis]MBB3667006.1 aminopeptidase N [Garicola koreensis]